MDRLVDRCEVQGDIEVLGTPREGDVIRGFKIDIHQGQDRP
jgi:hypothetical protein